jgi:hypothetical protein
MKRGLKILLISIVFCGLFCFAQCKKDRNKPKPDNPYGLPNATQTGAGVFACLINGEKFIAGDKPVYGNGAQLREDTLAIAGEPTLGAYFKGIQFTIQTNIQQGKIYYIDSVMTIAVYGTDSTCEGISSNVTISYSKTGTIQLAKFDTINKIVSGTFDGLAFPIPGCDTLHVTNGRFDYHYYS